MIRGTTRAVVLAAGQSSRFRRKQSKLLTKVCGREMVLFPLKVLEELSVPITVVLGYQGDLLRKAIEERALNNIDYVEQGSQLGTGHAVMTSQEQWDKENILILNGDMPLLKKELVTELIKKHEASGASFSFVTTHMVNPSGYGRVVEQGGMLRIYEQKDCPEEFLGETRVNAGIYLAKRSFLEQTLSLLSKNNKAGEFYVTDLVALAQDQGELVEAIPASFDVVRGVNTLQELWAVEQVMRSNIIKHWMANGVRFDLAQSIHIDVDVTIGADSFIGTGAHLLGNTTIGEGGFVAAFSIVENTKVGNDTTIHSHSVIQDSSLGDNVHVGPFARLRNNVSLANNAQVGNFVEIKQSVMGENSKAKHLSYIGDATIGNDVNIGAGTVFCNYDGKQKQKTAIEDGVFVGSNNTLIAPLVIEKDAYVAAGSTITHDVKQNDLAIARARQENKAGYADKLKRKKKGKKGKKVQFNFLGATKTRRKNQEAA